MVSMEITGPVSAGGGERFGTAGGPGTVQPATRVVSMLAAAVTCMGLAALLVSGKLVDIADRQPLGDSRDQWLGLASDVDRVANYLSLNRPYDLILDVRGAGTDAGRQVESIEAVAAAAGIEPDALLAVGDGGTGNEAVSGRDGSSSDPSPDPAAPDPAGPPGASPPEPSPPLDPAGGAVGSDPPGGEASGADPPGADPPGGEASGAAPSPPGASGPDSESETEPAEPAPAGRAVTPEAPLRIYVAGDSQATYLGQSLATGRARDLFDVTKGDRISTSLARPDYFNWPAEVVAVAEADDPELFVFFLGANDWQDMRSAEGVRLVRGTDEWSQEWSWRLFVTLEALKSEHRHVVWVGQPPMRVGWRDEGAAVMNEIARAVIAGRDDATMIDIWEMFGGDEDYRERVVGPDGEEFRARQNDGVHLRREASEWVADLVVDAVARRWVLPFG